SSTEVQAAAINANTASSTSQIRLLRMGSSSFPSLVTGIDADHPFEVAEARPCRLVGTFVVGRLLGEDGVLFQDHPTRKTVGVEDLRSEEHTSELQSRE